MGEGRKKAKESRVVPYPKLNPGCATAQACFRLLHADDDDDDDDVFRRLDRRRRIRRFTGGTKHLRR